MTADNRNYKAVLDLDKLASSDNQKRIDEFLEIADNAIAYYNKFKASVDSGRYEDAKTLLNKNKQRRDKIT